MVIILVGILVVPDASPVSNILESRPKIQSAISDEDCDLIGHLTEMTGIGGGSSHSFSSFSKNCEITLLTYIIHLNSKKVNIAGRRTACLNGDVMAKLWGKTVALADLKKLPETPGVYFFLGARKKILYIGKATVLRDRVRSYFARDIAETRGPKIVRMLEQARRIGYQSTESVLEALILETNLIKAHQPPYNTDAKDDKSYNYVMITHERYPRVLMARGRDLFSENPKSEIRNPKSKYVFGPFPHGMQLREAMKIIRKLFPYRDKCAPGESEQKAANSQQKGKILSGACFNRQIGLCPGVCTGEISVREYARTINHIRLFFEGKKGILIRRLEREMNMAARAFEFERAGEIKKTLFGLRHIQDIALIKDEVRTAAGNRQSLRIEAYDVAHLSGQADVGVMTVVTNGRADKDAYRMFRLRGKHGGNDLSALEEILKRRLHHSEWGVPDIVVTDGALLQLGVAEKMFSDVEVKPLLVGVVKDARHRPKDILNLPVGFAGIRNDILLANAEAHRFALEYHKRRRKKEFLG